MVNAAKLAQQAEKRKLLWGDNKSSANEKVINDELHFFIISNIGCLISG